MKFTLVRFPVVVYLVLILSLLTSGCQFNLARNDDGSLTVETSITQEALQKAIDSSIADPLVKNLTASLQSGYVLVSAERERLNNPGKTDTLSFRLDLGVSAVHSEPNGQLTASISDARLDGVALDQERVNRWNASIAASLQRIGQKQSNTSLQAVSITPEGVNMTWRVEKK